MIILVPHKYESKKIIYETELAYRQIFMVLSRFKGGREDGARTEETFVDGMSGVCVTFIGECCVWWV